MRTALTPKQIARAIDVSESSIKRWCDRGAIPTHYTAGGHRRVDLAALLQFLKEGNVQLVRPEALGLPPTSGRGAPALGRARDQFVEGLLEGNDSRCRQIAFDLYLAEHSLAVICDDVLAAAFREIGDRWACGAADVYQERRGCEIALRLLHELRAVLPSAPANAPIAIGCAPSGDPYHLGTTMAELVLRDAGWNAASLGENIPTESIAAAIRDHRPQLLWLSCSHIANLENFLSEYAHLHDEFGTEVAFAVGGYALVPEIRQQMRYSVYCESMQDFETFAQTLHRAHAD